MLSSARIKARFDHPIGTTSPAEVPWRRANSFAAASTSFSISTVVRIAPGRKAILKGVEESAAMVRKGLGLFKAG